MTWGISWSFTDGGGEWAVEVHWKCLCIPSPFSLGAQHTPLEIGFMACWPLFILNYSGYV